jgi:hypothetical protein
VYVRKASRKIEESIPGVDCDRYSGSDDDTPTPDDDNVAPTDDDTPPDGDLRKCMLKKNSKTCAAADCIWCDSKKYGFGLCMTGPTAESAASSDFFNAPPQKEKSG